MKTASQVFAAGSVSADGDVSAARPVDIIAIGAGLKPAREPDAIALSPGAIELRLASQKRPAGAGRQIRIPWAGPAASAAVFHFETVADACSHLRSHPPQGERILLLDQVLPRMEAIRLRSFAPTSPAFVLKAQSRPEAETPLVFPERATDLAAAGRVPAGPLFECRLHLRNLELERVREVLLRGAPTARDCLYVAGSIETLLGKPGGAVPEHVRPALLVLRESFFLSAALLDGDTTLVELRLAELTSELEPDQYRELEGNLSAALRPMVADLEKRAAGLRKLGQRLAEPSA